MLPLTCAQAWVKAHKNYPEMVAIVRTLAKVSLTNRNLSMLVSIHFAVVWYQLDGKVNS